MRKHGWDVLKHEFFAEYLERSWNKESFAYFMEMGTGKTKVLIDNMAKTINNLKKNVD